MRVKTPIKSMLFRLKSLQGNGARQKGSAAVVQWCNREYTDEDGNKIKGRGACRAGCWVDTAIRLLDALPF